MSGGHFDYKQYAVREIADRIEHDIAWAYAKRIDWMMSGDDSEESMHNRLKEELEEFEKEYASKDWTILE